MELKRADLALWEAGLAGSRTKAAELIKKGLAYANGKLIEKPSELVGTNTVFSLAENADLGVSRAGEKLRAAIDAFAPSVKDKVFADIGASTGGFTECLLKNGAARVYSVDVGRDQLHPSLRSDSRVTVMEGVNARTLTAESFDREIDGVVMDVSFISQALIYPAIASFLKKGGPMITLVKPQFEAGRKHVGKNGIVKDRDGAVYKMIMEALKSAAAENGFEFERAIPSPIKGGDGNTEYLALFYRK